MLEYCLLPVTIILWALIDISQGWGWACEQVVAIDVVTADGRLLRADETQNNELYWAARGCGPGFPGIITRFHLKTRGAPKVMRSSAYIYPVSMYNLAFDWLLKVWTYSSIICIWSVCF